MTTRSADRHVWEFTWFRDLLLLAVVAFLAWIAVRAAAVTLPLLVGLAFAYVAQPVIRWLHRRLHMPRWLSAAVVLGVLVGSLATVLAYVLPDLYAQANLLAHNLPHYVDRLGQRFGLDWKSLSAAWTPRVPNLQVPRSGTLESTGAAFAQAWSFGFGVLSTFIGTTVGVGTAVLVSFVSFVWFSANMERIGAWMAGFVPLQGRERFFAILGRMDRSVAGNLRGRVLQASIFALELTIGWALVGVRYWLVLGLFIGALNLVPYIAMVGAPLVLALNWADAVSTGAPITFWHTFALPVAIHLTAQALDGWVVEPVVQSRATELSGMAVLASVMTGATLLGLFGMVIAVPTAACVKILAHEVLLPWVKDWLAALTPPRREHRQP